MKKQVKIHIGELYASKEPAIIKTLLGSCVSACLFDSVNKIGGMNHILLPGKADLKNYNDSARYGINAMELLINKMINLGAKKNKITAKLFGGGHILKDLSIKNSPGIKNVQFVKDFLEFEKIPIISQNTGGAFGRVIFFHSDTADVFMKKIFSHFNPQVAEAEANYVNKLSNELQKTSEITFF